MMSRRKKKTFNYFLAKAAIKNKENIKLRFSPKSRKASVDFTLRDVKYRLLVEHYISPFYLEFPVSTKAIRERQVILKRDDETKIYYGYTFDNLCTKHNLDPQDYKWLEAIDMLREQAKFPDDLHFNKDIEYRQFQDCQVTYEKRDASLFSNL